MTVVQRVIIQQPATCGKCSKPLQSGKVAIKERIQKGVVIHLHIKCYAKQSKESSEE